MPPLERLHYYPGQRLDAVELNLEANYELTVRRLLNQGLFTPGVVSGLEVAKTGAREVTIAPGLALDVKGRELYLSDPLPLAVPNQKPAGGGDTYYLLITYDEQKVPASDGGCAPSNGSNTFSRIRETPFLAFTADWPNPKLCSDNLRDLNCGIFLASVTLDNNCQVASVDTGLREYSFPAHSSQVHEASYEGEKDIAPGEPKRLFFHIRGGSPHGVILHLRGAQFSRLWYTEMGDHSHTFTANAATTIGPSKVDIAHSHHILGTAHTDDSGDHNHSLWSGNPAGFNVHELVAQRVPDTPLPYQDPPIAYYDHNLSPKGDPETSWVSPPTLVGSTSRTGTATFVPNHHHTINLSNQTTTDQTPTTSATDHTHSFDATAATIGHAGVSDVQSRTGSANSFITDLQVKLDNVDITANILKQLGWTSALGGTNFNNDIGAAGIDLLRLPLMPGQSSLPDLNPKPHILEFSINSGSGGKLLYNLYVE